MAARRAGCVVNLPARVDERNARLVSLCAATTGAVAALAHCWAAEYRAAGIRIRTLGDEIDPHAAAAAAVDFAVGDGPEVAFDGAVAGY